jgi:hypothetical protein
LRKRPDALKEQIRLFVQQYGRKAQKGHDPNDRQYDRKLAALVSRMSAEELDAILNEGSD